MTKQRYRLNVQAAEFKSSSEVSAGAVAIIYNCLLDLDNLEYSEPRTHYERKCLAEVRRMYLDQLVDLLDFSGGSSGVSEIPF